MAEGTIQYGLRIELKRVELGAKGGPNSIKQQAGTGANGATIMTAVNALDINSPSQTDVEINDAQFAGLCGYIGLIGAGVDTSGIETDIATDVAAN
jgi:hypothetical protein